MTVDSINSIPADDVDDVDGEEDEDEDQWDDWQDDEVEDAQCLFCSKMAKPKDILEHCRVGHAFDLRLVKQALDLDIYGTIKLVNYVRTLAQRDSHLTIHDFSETLIPDASWLNGETYLKPVIENDPMLYVAQDDDDFDQDSDPVTGTDLQQTSPPEIHSATLTPHQQGRRPSNAGSILADSQTVLQDALLEAQKRAEAAEARARDVLNAWKEYREEVTRTVLGTDRADIALPADEEVDYYFGSYAETEIHESMLKDRVRTESYRDFMYDNKDLFKDKIVLDVGCGTGILSMFAARAGARQVFAIDNSPIIEKAKKIVAENGLENIITCIRGKAEEILLPGVDKVDILISEWMGYFLLFEGMLDSVFKARDRWLKPSGLMVPNVARMYMAGIEDEDWVNDKYHFWNDVYGIVTLYCYFFAMLAYSIVVGFKMTLMKETFMTNAHVDITAPDTVITDACEFKEIDLEEATCESLDFASTFTMAATRPGRIHAICGWFDIDFEGEKQGLALTSFSTSPTATATHWKQTLFALDNPIDVVAGQRVEGDIRVSKRAENERELDVVLKIRSGSDEVRTCVYVVK
ncbi:hypothetical protein SmJEL517_g03080 [Synchytrium microbalum]|uniref:type I protein arginine methyltransferase n=1 Tax=Synchytrium microbalum TaxID=1806994 RepID=A0A507C893_9FUNG|nr:uncharacterized protein SmJEL517_g03080 [Synchytrium microbalum]TPX34234.1 hypothetical protein SmJEL517_g03080 [Synchytrium microbalum]